MVGVEDGPPVIAKFYRPERWSDAAIDEEHAFTLELAAAELPFCLPRINHAWGLVRGVKSRRKALVLTR